MVQCRERKLKAKQGGSYLCWSVYWAAVVCFSAEGAIHKGLAVTSLSCLFLVVFVAAAFCSSCILLTRLDNTSVCSRSPNRSPAAADWYNMIDTSYNGILRSSSFCGSHEVLAPATCLSPHPSCILCFESLPPCAHHARVLRGVVGARGATGLHLLSGRQERHPEVVRKENSICEGFLG